MQTESVQLIGYCLGMHAGTRSLSWQGVTSQVKACPGRDWALDTEENYHILLNYS